MNGASSFDLPKADITSDSPAAAIKKLSVEEPMLKKHNKTFESTRRQPLSPEASEFCPRVVRTKVEKIKKTPFEELPSVKPAIDDMISDMKRYRGDTFFLENLLEPFFKGTSRYGKSKLDFTQRKMQEAYEQALSLIQQDLLKVEALESERVNEMNVRLADLTDKEKLANLMFLKAQKDLSNIQESVATKRENVSKLANTPYVSKKETDALKRIGVLLEESRQDLVAFDLFL
ncbi:hypothetical protein CDL12_18331 [Handroanthus impetiginosus]|uniref:Uncharacterized protein n=1 Tax=Handroanthus impetiginosus TaxID=429701 RepID=A0A2G9GUY5_9LAMI|nr:hypothetical protein CDL12_18331 [Handroanthus impetiginosus]